MNEELSMIVSLDIEKSASNIREQLNALESKLKNDKIKITAEIDSDDLTKKLVKDLDEARKASKELQKQFDSMAKSMKDKTFMQDTEKDTQNIKQLGKQLDDLKEKTKAFAIASGSNGEGLFSFAEFKDANGNLERVDTTLKGMDGTVQKLKFSMDATGKAELFQQTNLDKTEAELLKMANTMAKVTEEANRADALMSSNVYTQMAKDTMEASNSILDLNNQLQRKTITVNEAESKLRGYKKANDEAVAVDRKRIETLGKLNDMMEKLNKNNDRDMAFKNVAQGTKGMLETARDMNELNTAMTSFQHTQDRFSSVQTENELDGLRRAIQDTVRDTEEMARKFGKNMDWGESGISRYFDEMEGDVNHSTKELQGTLEKATDQLKVVTKEYKQALRMDSYGKDVGSGDELKKLIDNDDIAGVKRYISELSKMNAETVKLKQVTTNAGLPLKQLEVGFESSGQEMKKITYTIDDTVNGMNKLRQGFTQLDYNANRNLSTMQHFLVSLKRIPAYLASAYLFDGIRDGMRWVVQDIMQVEKELIEIQRVIDGGISLDELFTGSVEIADRLGNSMHDVINAVGELARTYGDFNEEQLLSVANTATLMSNVSELGVEESISSLVATMKAFNIEAQDSVRIVDAFNEVDNKFAISTTQIASAMNKSASTAKTFGVSMEQNIGYVTAIGSTTMESGEIIGNSLKTIFSRITTLPASISILESVGVAVNEIGESGEQVRPVADIMGDLANKWVYLTDAQRQNIGVQIAGRNQLSRFLALMNNHETAVDATTTALNSQGSAVRENQAYLTSYEANVNRMKTAFSGLAQSMGDAFLKSGISIGIDSITGVTKAVSGMIDTFGLLPVVAGTLTMMTSRFGAMGQVVDGVLPTIKKLSGSLTGLTKSNISNNIKTTGTSLSGLSKNITLTGDSVKTAGGKIKTASSHFKVINGEVIKTAPLMSPLAKGFSKVGLAIKGMIATAGSMLLITGAVMAVSFAVEKLIGAYQKAKEEAEKVEATQKTMVESYRNSGDSLNKMSDDYDRLYKKYGEFNQAVSSGKIDPQINTEDYELYSKITDELATKLPTVISYTDAQGVSYLKAGDAVKQQVEYAKSLSIERAKLETLEIEEKMAKGADKAKDAYKGLLEVQKEMADLEAGAIGEADIAKYDEKATAIEKFFKTITGQYEGANGWDYVFLNAGFADAEAERQATAEVTSKKMQTYIIDEIEARNKLQSAIADQLTLVKDSGSSYMEAQGHVENLGSTSQSIVQDFAQMNSGYLDQVTTMHQGVEDLDKRADAQAESLKERTNNLAESTRLLSDRLNKAYEDGLKNVDMTGTLVEDTAKVEEYGQAFEQMAGMIPKSMMLASDATGGLSADVENLISNFSGLGKVEDGIADKSMTYTDARIALQEMNVTGKDADQIIRNFAQASNNAQIEAGLLATTVDESAESMSDLKTATLDTVDALQEITGVSSGNVSALKSYMDGIALSKTTFGDAYESSELYAQSLDGLANYHNMSTEGVLQNMDALTKYGDIMSLVTVSQEEGQEATLKLGETTAENGEIFAQVQKKMQESGLNVEQSLGIVLGLTEDLSIAFQGLDGIDFANTEDETTRLATAFITAKDGTDELTEAMEALGQSHPELYTVQTMFRSFADQIKEGTSDYKAFEEALEGQLDPPEIDLLLGIMEQVTGVEQEVQDKHKETSAVLANNPLNLQVKETGVAETEGKVGGLTNHLDAINGKTSTVNVDVTKEQAQSDLDGVINQALELDATEAQITTIVNGAETSGQQITGLANLIEDLSGGSVTANEVLGGLGSAVDTSTASGKVRGIKEEVDGLSTGVKDQVTAIQESIKALNGSFDGVNIGVESVGNLKNILSDLNTSVDTAKGGVLNSVAQVNTALSGISGEANPAITAMSNMKNTFNDLKASLTSTSTVLSSAGGGFTAYASSVSSVSYSANTAKDAINGYAQALASSANSASVAQSRVSALTQAKQTESSAFLASKIIIASTGDAYGTLAGKSTQSASKINSDSMRIVMAVIRMSNAYKTHVSAISGVIAGMSRSVSGSTSSMIGQHNRQADAIKRLASSARDAKGAISTLNSAVASSMGGMLSFISRAKSTATQAEKTRSAVNKMREANSGNGIVGAVRNFIGMSTDRLVTAITGIDTGSAIGSLYSAISSSGSTGSISANAGGETSIGATGGTSGTIKASFYPTADIGMDGKMAFSALANDYTRTEEMEDVYEIDNYERKYQAIELALIKVTAQMGRLEESSEGYRKGLRETIKLENQRLSLVNQELASEKSRLKNIDSQLKKLPAVGKQSIAQRKKYNELQKKYDETLGNINSLTKEQQDLTDSAIENVKARFTSLLEEIANTYDKATARIKRTIDETDFKIDLLEYTDPDNIVQQIKLLTTRQQALAKQEATLRQQEQAYEKQYSSAWNTYGADGEITLEIADLLEKTRGDIRDTILDVKKTEKEILDIRTDTAEESIDKLKDYYDGMKKMSTDAIKAEQDALEKAYEKREKIYDAEIEKIESVYDAKLKAIDDAKTEETYQEEMATLSADRAELQRQIAIASRDTSLIGKKNLSELQKELTDINKEISDAQKERQAELLKEQLEAEKDAQVKAIEDKKTVDETNKDSQIEELEKRASELEDYYDSIIDDQEYWDKLKDDVTNGKFNALTEELKNMYGNIANMNNGVFDGLLDEFSSFSEDAQAEFLRLNKILLRSLGYSDGVNSLGKLRELAGIKSSGLGTSINGNQNFTSANTGEGASIAGEGGTSGILSASSAITSNIMQTVGDITPRVKVKGVSEVLEGLVNITGGDTYNYEVNIPVQNFNGTKKDKDNLLKEFEKTMQKLGK